MTALEWCGFLAAAGAGAVARAALGGRLQRRSGLAWPVGTFVVNISGSFALGIVVGLAVHHGFGDGARTIVGTGGLGAYTTFSTFTEDTVRLLGGDRWPAAAAYAVGSAAASIATAALGFALTNLG